MTTQEFKQFAAKKLSKLSTLGLKAEIEKLYMKIHQIDSASRMVLFVAYEVLENKIGEDAYDEFMEELQQKLYA